jgi:hypothetical protein
LFADLFQYFLDRYLQQSQSRSKKQLAKNLSVDPAAIIHWEKGRRIPQDSGLVLHLANSLGLNATDTEYLLVAWQVNKTLNELAPFAATALQGSYEISAVLVAVQRQLKEAKERLDKFQARP